MGISLYEQETTIIFNAEEKTAIVESFQKSIINKLDNLCKERPKDYKFIKPLQYGKRYEVNKTCIKFAKKRDLTDEQRKVYSERAKGLHASRTVEENQQI